MEFMFEWGKRTYIMGILNVTPDSFSDGGEFNQLDAAVVQADRMVRGGADILDIGGQSTRPGALDVSEAEEFQRVVPVVTAIRQTPWGGKIPISVDTTRASIAEAAIKAGANWVNDISGATFDPDMLSVVARLGVPVVLMHIRGTPKTMQQLTDYENLIGEIEAFFEARINAAIKAGIGRDQIILDPGIGFAKTYEQNLEILRQLKHFRGLGCPILVGASRKSFIGHILQQPDPKQRVWGTSAACTAAIAGLADILRVHDVAEMWQVSRVADAIFRGVS